MRPPKNGLRLALACSRRDHLRAVRTEWALRLCQPAVFRRRSGPASALLDDVGQFVRKKLPPLASRCVLSSPKHHVAANRIGQRIHFSRRFRRSTVRVHAHGAKIIPETGFHGRADLGVERLAGRMQRFVNDCRDHTMVLCFSPGVLARASLHTPLRPGVKD
jgi:hypothetical protein